MKDSKRQKIMFILSCRANKEKKLRDDKNYKEMFNLYLTFSNSLIDNEFNYYLSQ